MKNEIYTVETEGNLEFGLRVIVCEAAEAVLDWEDPTGNGNQDECNSVCSDTHAAIRKLLPPISAESDSHFPNWHGGMYSHQAEMYGFSSVEFGVVQCFVREVAVEDEDGELVENDWEEITLDKMPQSVKQAIEAVEDAHRKAIREVEAAQDAEQARLDAEEAAEEAAEDAANNEA